jgi:hypothetical protein
MAGPDPGLGIVGALRITRTNRSSATLRLVRTVQKRASDQPRTSEGIAVTIAYKNELPFSRDLPLGSVKAAGRLHSL